MSCHSVRLDFTVVGPAVNEVARIEALCEPLNRNLLVSAELAVASGVAGERLRSLGYHTVRGVRDAGRSMSWSSIDSRTRPN